MRSSIVFAFVSIALAAACGKKKPLTDTLPADEVTTDDMIAEQKRVQAGETVGQALVVPKIELDYRGIVGNGRVVVPASELDTTKLVRIQKLSNYLKGLKEHWKQIHPNEEFHGIIDLDAAPEADALVGESIVETAASVGYRRVRLKIEDVAWDAMLGVIGPPRPDDAEEKPKPEVRLRVRRGLVGFDVDVLAQGACSSTPNVKLRVLKADALAAIVGETCATVDECLLSVESSPGALLTIAKLLAPAYGAGRPTNVYLDFFPAEGVAMPDGGLFAGSFENAWQYRGAELRLEWPTDGGLGGLGTIGVAIPKTSKVTLGAVQVTGRISVDAADKAVRAKLDAVRACYDDALKRGTAQGRVTLKLVVDAAGAVAQACSGGSDLPDPAALTCMMHAMSSATFPAPESGAATIVVPYVMSWEEKRGAK